MIDSILIYQHNVTRDYIAVRSSSDIFIAPSMPNPSYSSPALAVKHLTPSLCVVLTPDWLLVDILTSDIYPELFL